MTAPEIEINIRLVHVSKMRPHPNNLRGKAGDVTGLAASLRARGQLSTCVVQPDPDWDGHYLILAGERRWKAAIKARKARLVSIVIEPQTRSGATVIMLIENGQRRQLTPMEYARGFGILRDGSDEDDPMTVEEISAATGYKPPSIRRYLRLLDLSEDTQIRLENKEITVGQALNALSAHARRARRRPGPLAAESGTACEPDFGFTRRNPQQPAARALCAAAGHAARRRYGGACAECWEHAIRVDEREHGAADAGPRQDADLPAGRRLQLVAEPAPAVQAG